MFDRTRLWPRASLIRTLFVLAVLISLFVAGPDTSPVAFTYTVPQAGPPANDNFANAEFLPLGLSGVITGTNVGATKELPLEPNHAGNAGGASVWYRWQAPVTARFTFITYRSGFNTLLAVYTGDTLPGNPVTSNDNDTLDSFSPCFDRTSRVSFNATAGVVYRIAVDRHSSDTPGTIVLRWGRSANISGRISGASGGSIGDSLSPIVLMEDSCRDNETFRPGFLYTDVPTGGSYSVSFRVTDAFFQPGFLLWDPTKSIAPLTGTVTDYNFYKTSPAANIVGTVTVPGGDAGLTVTCSALLVSRQAFFLGNGKYQCSAMPSDANYVVTPSKPGFTFTPSSRDVRISLFNQDVFGVDFTGVAAPTRTISGRVLHPNGTTGVSGVTINLSGTQTASRVTDANGNYSFTEILQGGNYTITPASANFTFSPTSLSFNNVTANQTDVNFTTSFVLQLVLDDLGQVAALDSVLLMRDPFPVINNGNLLNRGVDRNTRIALFLSNFQLGPGEAPSSVVINLIGSNSQSYDIPAEDVRPASDPTFSRVTFRLPDTLTPGTCTLLVKARGLTSNIGALRIRN